MLNRLFAASFMIALFLVPVASLASFAASADTSPSVLQQKSMCLTTGVGCGAGHVLLPAFGRM
ncbi:hypothetical protein JM93_01880 [Roseibium hamelinense]|uniref:Uncharacterized protein n=1 Tax=Roseibium hamelinense TaxID=150831 RepID=A0A562T8S7_9HYPH|nr:sugar transporter [Roseibium hamelinense]MTI43532.1 sugar transporter [Roseibium hamelinense]TWI89674.1 hypothetical protein JM93_01880 [Roseibium hamelinense]